MAQEIEEILGTPANDVLRISAKEGTNVPALLEAIVHQVPPPRGQRDQPLRALIFDSHYDAYKGVDRLRAGGRWRHGDRARRSG